MHPVHVCDESADTVLLRLLVGHHHMPMFVQAQFDAPMLRQNEKVVCNSQFFPFSVNIAFARMLGVLVFADFPMTEILGVQGLTLELIRGEAGWKNVRRVIEVERALYSKAGNLASCATTSRGVHPTQRLWIHSTRKSPKV